MDQWKPEDLAKAVPVVDLAPCTSLQPHPVSSGRLQNSHPDVRQRPEVEAQDPIAARKVQKADREKLRRDRLNEHFLELGNALDPDRPKNDKATILTDTIQVLKDLNGEVNRLKTEHAALSEESRELMQEKNELREEKACLKSDIDNLNAQYQQRVRIMFPWTAIDHSVGMAPPYSYPVPIAIPPAPVNPPVEQPSAQYASTSHISSKQESRSKSPDHKRPSNAERCSESPDVATELELKMPGSSAHRDSSSGGKKGKHSHRKERNITDRSASSRYSSSQGFQDSSNSVGDTPKPDN
ncbi:hypothetical protein L6164_020159 [Bauhinia variegata]|uniref:Uncharacterized protein n=1 Tax=Bauhinia variegata TaxID=167791 RepID=A0ACB9MUH2_BAUVA|nr:hypothetical protein L6164_020159 [Bauhinia variegata]